MRFKKKKIDGKKIKRAGRPYQAQDTDLIENYKTIITH